MSNPRKSKAARYSAQIRASQYDPDLDVDFYTYQYQAQSATHPSSCPSSSTYYDQYHYAASAASGSAVAGSIATTPLSSYFPPGPASASSSNSAATTFINLNSQNNSSAALPETEASSSTQAAAASSSSVSPPEFTTLSPPPAPASTSSTSPFTSILKSIHAKSKSLSSRPSISRNGQQQQPTGSRHTKNASMASTHSRLVSRASRSSLQLNLRTHQMQHHPSMHTSPGQSPIGPWDPSLSPNPLYPNSMDPAFIKEQQLTAAAAAAGGGHPYLQQQHQLHKRASIISYIQRDPARNSVMSYVLNRREDAKFQLEQEREYQQARLFRQPWTRSKIMLFLANTLLLGYSIASTVIMVMSWKGAEWTRPFLDSGIMMIANRNLLMLMMVTAPFGIFVAIVGYAGILSQNRKILSIYAILLWPLFALITSIGYIGYRRLHVSLYQRLKFSWINEYTRDDRLVIQNALSCCGFRSLADYPSYDLHCFPRAPLPSCENRFLQYQQDLLSNASTAAFIMLPIQLLVMLVALLCSNHIDNLYRSAHPITPKLYTQ